MEGLSTCGKATVIIFQFSSVSVDVAKKEQNILLISSRILALLSPRHQQGLWGGGHRLFRSDLKIGVVFANLFVVQGGGGLTRKLLS